MGTGTKIIIYILIALIILVWIFNFFSSVNEDIEQEIVESKPAEILPKKAQEKDTSDDTAKVKEPVENNVDGGPVFQSPSEGEEFLYGEEIVIKWDAERVEAKEIKMRGVSPLTEKFGANISSVNKLSEEDHMKGETEYSLYYSHPYPGEYKIYIVDKNGTEFESPIFLIKSLYEFLQEPREGMPYFEDFWLETDENGERYLVVDFREDDGNPGTVFKGYSSNAYFVSEGGEELRRDGRLYGEFDDEENVWKYKTPGFVYEKYNNVGVVVWCGDDDFKQWCSQRYGHNNGIQIYRVVDLYELSEK